MLESFFLILSWRWGSKLDTAIDAFWLNNAQHNGVANVKTKPQNKIWIGVLAHGIRFKIPFLSRTSIKTGVKTIWREELN